MLPASKGNLSDLTQVQGPPLPAVSNLATAFGPPDYTGNTAESLTWGGMVSGAQSEVDYMLNDSGNWTEASSSSGTGWEQGYALLSTAYPEEGGQYTYQVRQYYNHATVPITGYSNFVQIGMGVYPFAPPYNTLTNVPLSPTSAQLLWPEASEGETDQLLQWSTDGFTTIAGSATVLLDATGFTLTGLTPNTHYSVRLAERKTGAPDSLWATGDVYTPAIPSISITAVQDAAELGPDDHPQDGWFELTRTGLPRDSLTVSVDLSGTAVLGTQYATGAGNTSPVQATFAPGATAAMLEILPLLDGLDDPATTNVTATIEPPASANVGTGTATLSIAELPTLQDVTVTDKHLAKNVAVATDESPVDLYVMQPMSGSAKIGISADVDGTTGEHVLWNVIGPSTWSGSKVNDFSVLDITVSLKPNATNYDFSVVVGVDKNGNGILDQPEVERTIVVHVYSITVDQIISDQVPGIEQNYLNGNAGVNAGKPTPKNYLLMGTDTSDAARVKVTFSHTGDLPPNLGFAICPSGTTSPFPGSSDLLSDDTALIIVPTASSTSIGDDPDVVGFGPSLNGDDSSGRGEVSATDPRQLKIIDKDEATQAIKFLQGLDNQWATTPPKLPTAANFLFAFLNDFAPGLGAVNSTVAFTSFTDPTMLRAMHHHVGVFYAAGKLTMDLAAYPSTASLAAQIAKDPAFVSREITYMKTIAPTVLTTLPSIPPAGTWLTWTPGYSGITLEGLDDYYSIGDAALSGITFYAKVTKAANGDIVATSISIGGTVSDVADFDWDFPMHGVLGPVKLALVRQAVQVQARYNRVGDPGHVFEVQVQLNNTTGIGWDFTKNKEI